MRVVQLIAPGFRLAFAADPEPCDCWRCNTLAARSGGARQLRLRIVTLPETGTPAAPTAGVPVSPSLQQPESTS